MLKLIEVKQDVKFYTDENEVLYQQIQDGDIEIVVDGEQTYKWIEEIGGAILIKYDLNGLHGFSIWKGDKCIEDNFWCLEDAVLCAKRVLGDEKDKSSCITIDTGKEFTKTVQVD